MQTITIERSQLANALGGALRVMSSRNTLPMLNFVRVRGSFGEGITLTATDLDTWGSFKALAQVDSDIDVCLPAADLNTHASKLGDGPITIQIDESINKATVLWKKTRFTLATAPAADYPEEMDLDGTAPALTLPALVLKDMLRMTTFAAADHESKGTLMGVYFDARGGKLHMVATDTHRLAMRTEELSEAVEVSAIVAAKPLAELEKLLKSGDVNIHLNDKVAIFATVDFELTCRLIAGTYPNYEKVIPRNTERQIQCPREAMLSATRRCLTAADGEAKRIQFRIDGQTVQMCAERQSGERVEDEFDVAAEGGDLHMAFNGGYLSEVLGIMTDDAIRLNLNGPLNPGILRGEANPGFLFIAMPMHVETQKGGAIHDG